MYIYQRHLFHLTLSWQRPLSYRNQSIDLQSKSMDWFLYDNGLHHERVKSHFSTFVRFSLFNCSLYVVRCAIWYHLYNLKNVTVFFTFSKLYKWYQIAQRITYANEKYWLMRVWLKSFGNKDTFGLGTSVSMENWIVYTFCNVFHWALHWMYWDRSWSNLRLMSSAASIFT